MTDIYRARRAVPADKAAIIGLIDSAAAWLGKHKNTNQWARPWPDEPTRDGRIIRGIEHLDTWMVERGGILAATITYRDQANPSLWTETELKRQRAVYVSRLIVDRDFAGQGLGADLIDWAGARGMKQWGADWIRVDVWTTNTGLHNYYKGQDFEYLRTVEVEHEWDYPSAVLFQKPTAAVSEAAAMRFEVADREVSLAGRRT
jgi:GNAT superfamily N-acetyltransferase